MSQPSSTRIPNFLKARSEIGLRRLMLRNNTKHGMQFDYQIMFAKASWYAWYYLDIESDFTVQDEVKEVPSADS